MAEIITQLDMYIPEKKVTGITQDAFWSYMNWQDNKKIITRTVRKPFEEGAFSKSGYYDSNRPEEETETPLSIGEMEF